MPWPSSNLCVPLLLGPRREGDRSTRKVKSLSPCPVCTPLAKAWPRQVCESLAPSPYVRIDSEAQSGAPLQGEAEAALVGLRLSSRPRLPASPPLSCCLTHPWKCIIHALLGLRPSPQRLPPGCCVTRAGTLFPWACLGAGLLHQRVCLRSVSRVVVPDDAPCSCLRGFQLRQVLVSAGQQVLSASSFSNGIAFLTDS